MQALNLNLEDLGAQPRYPGGFVLDHGNHLIILAAILFCSVPQMSGYANVSFSLADALISRSNMLASQKRRAAVAAAAVASPALCHSS